MFPILNPLPTSLPMFDSLDCSPPSSSVHEILEVTILEWVAPGDLPYDPAIPLLASTQKK